MIFDGINKSSGMIHWNIRQNAVTEVGDIAAGSESIQHFRHFFFDLRNRAQQSCGIQISLQGNTGTCQRACSFRTNTPVSPQARTTRRVIPQRTPGSWQIKSPGLLFPGLDSQRIYCKKNFEIIRAKQAAPGIESNVSAGSHLLFQIWWISSAFWSNLCASTGCV